MRIEVEREYHLTIHGDDADDFGSEPLTLTLTYEEVVALANALHAFLIEGPSTVGSRREVASRQSSGPLSTAALPTVDSDEEERPWTQPEESVLWELVNIGRPVPVIAEQLGRSRREIAWRIKQAGGEV